MNRKHEDAAAALALMLAVWTLLLGRFLLDPVLGTGASILLIFLLATVLVLATRAPNRASPLRRSGGLLAVGWAAGFASYPAWVALIVLTGVQLGLPHAQAPAPARDPLVLFSTLLLAPIFEELLYRERLLVALTRLAGPGVALVVTSCLFALPHWHPWNLLTTFLVGLVLGIAAQAGKSIALCIGVHIGLNCAAALCGVPPNRLCLPVPMATLLGFGGLALAVWVAKRGRGRAAAPGLYHPVSRPGASKAMEASWEPR